MDDGSDITSVKRLATSIPGIFKSRFGLGDTWDPLPGSGPVPSHRASNVAIVIASVGRCQCPSRICRLCNIYIVAQMYKWQRQWVGTICIADNNCASHTGTHTVFAPGIRTKIDSRDFNMRIRVSRQSRTCIRRSIIFSAAFSAVSSSVSTCTSALEMTISSSAMSASSLGVSSNDTCPLLISVAVWHGGGMKGSWSLLPCSAVTSLASLQQPHGYMWNKIILKQFQCFILHVSTSTTTSFINAVVTCEIKHWN